MNRNNLLDQARRHYHSYEQILSYQQSNFKESVTRFQKELNWWTNGIDIHSLEDLHKLPVRNSHDIINQQKINPPYGIWPKGEMVFTSSASTNNQRKVFPRPWENYCRCLIGSVRTIENHGVGNDDVVMSTDSGGMFAGHSMIEDSSILLLGATRVRCNSPLPFEKLKIMEQFGVTVFSGNPTKLLRMSLLDPKRYLSKPLKMVISTGATLTDAAKIADAFGVDRVVDMFGAVEIGNIAWTCNQGHSHVNIDLCYVEQGRYFSNLSNLPVLRYEVGETLFFSYKGTCTCGSNLPTVDRFITSNIDRSTKD